MVGARGIDMAVIEGETIADTIYAIDRVADDTLLEWFEQHWPDVELVSEGLDEPVVVGDDPTWTVIVDTIDGTRGLMYDKRPAWCLAAAAPRGGSLRDVVAAAMTELPTVKQGAADQLSGTRGRRRRRRADRPPRRTTRAARPCDRRRRPTSSTASPGSPSSSSRARSRWPSSRPSCSPRLGSRHVFDDEYISSGGQLHELIAGHDRFVADLRPLVDPDAFACHPYDVCTAMLLEEAGGVVTDPRGAPLDVPLDTTSPVAWVGLREPGARGAHRSRSSPSWSMTSIDR